MILPQQMTQKELAEQWKQGVQIMYRNQTKEVRIGDVVIGGDHPLYSSDNGGCKSNQRD